MQSQEQRPRPNIVLVLTDHFRPDALGSETPNLMRLAAEGARFENAYCASPLCQPSRNCIITGLYPSQHGVCGNQNEPISSGLRHRTFMHSLRQAGYYTAMIGKHHYLDRYGIGMDVRQDDAELRDYGLDEVFQVVDDGENMHNDDEYTEHLQQGGTLDEFRQAFRANAWQCQPHPFKADETADGFIGTNGIRFALNYPESEAGREARPFYLNLSFIGPHPPYWHPEEVRCDPGKAPAPVGAPDTPSIRTRRTHYLAKCKLIDGYVGRFIDALKQGDLYDNTVIIFTSDHGDNLGDHGVWDKRHFYEQSCGVPLVLSGPGIATQERMCGNRVSKLLVSHLDLYPTILRLAGAPVPGDRKRTGRDLLAMLNDDPATARDAVFAELATAAMVRTANWKLVFDPEQGGVCCLFNLRVDPDEEHNLAGAPGYEHVTRELVERLLSQRIRLTQATQVKEEQRLQTVRILARD